ncbi:MAG: sugar ABC transporter permease [Rhodospirillales bacterium]|nr:sugar ABC transporter permease [Rhodospirillales bacterium]
MPAAALLAARRRFAWWLMAPALAMFAANAVFPLLYALDVSVRNYQLLIPVPARFVGLANYAQIFSDPLFWSSVKVTLWFIAGVVFLELPAALGLALLFASLPRRAGVAVTVLLVPTILAPSVVGFQWAQIYNYQFGPLNYLLGLAGLGHPVWTASPTLALPSLIAIDFWEWTPFMVLLLFAGLSAVPRDIIEAARVDGSSYPQIFRRIMLPLMRPVIGIALVLRVLMSFKTFDIIYILTAGGPGAVTENLAYYTYIQGFRYFNLGYASALAVIQLIVVAALANALLRLARRPGLVGTA